jgi:hypothetical protein
MPVTDWLIADVSSMGITWRWFHERNHARNRFRAQHLAQGSLDAGRGHDGAQVKTGVSWGRTDGIRYYKDLLRSTA